MTTQTSKPVKQLMASQVQCEFLPCDNRPVNMKSVNQLRRNVQEYGIMKGIVLIRTALFSPDKQLQRYFIADGQVLYIVCKKLNRLHQLPAMVIEKSFTSVQQIANFLSILNSSQKKWDFMNYINAYANAGNKDYQMLLDRITKYNSAPLATAMIYSNLLPDFCIKYIKNGSWIFSDIEKADQFMPYLKEILDTVGYSTERRLCDLFSHTVFNWFNPDTYNHATFIVWLELNKSNLINASMDKVENMLSTVMKK